MWMDYKNYIPDSREKLRLYAAVALLTAVLAVLFYDSLIPVLAAIPLCYPARRIYCSEMLRRRRNELSRQFRDLLFCLSASFATGRHMGDALTEAEAELKELYEPESPIMTEIRWMTGSIRGGTMTDIQCWMDLAARCGNEDISDFVQAYGACRETGGDMISMMEQTSRIIGEKINIEREIAGMVVQKKAEGRIITLMPVVIILFLRVVSPEYLRVMYDSVAGFLLMTAALAATAGTYWMIERITEIEV